MLFSVKNKTCLPICDIRKHFFNKNIQLSTLMPK